MILTHAGNGYNYFFLSIQSNLISDWSKVKPQNQPIGLMRCVSLKSENNLLYNS